MRTANIFFVVLGVVMLVESLARKFLNTSETGGDADKEGFTPRWYHRFALAAFSIGIIVWNAVKLYR